MKGVHKLLPLTSMLLWITTSSFINLGVSTEGEDVSASSFSPFEVADIDTKEIQNQCPTNKKHHREGPIFFGSALFWKANETGLTYAATSRRHSATDPLIGKAEISKLDFNWDYGFKVGIGVEIPHGGWDTTVSYTWFRDKADGKTNSPEQGILIPQLISSSKATLTGLVENKNAQGLDYTYLIQGVSISQAQARWKLHLKVIDWDLGRQMILFKWLSLRPFIGVKASWIDQDYDIYYKNYTKFTFSNNRPENITVKQKCDYWGVGPMAGMQTQFWLRHGFSIYGNAAISLVYGQFDVKHKEASDFDISNKSIVDTKLKYYAARAITDMQLGLRWDSSHCKTKKAGRCKCDKGIDRMNFSVAVGWDQHLFFEQNQFFKFNDVSNASNFVQGNDALSVQGGTISLRLDF
jgi:hypothetical protein